MSARVNYFKIGLFVMVSLAIALAAILILGAGVLFQKQILAETYIDESVQGLEVGAAVRYRGVYVGKVKQITFVSRYYQQVTDADPGIRYVLVRFALYPEVFKGRFFSDFGQRLRQEVNEQGLRCRLAPQGLTGMLYLEVDYVTDPAARPPLPITWEPTSTVAYVPSVPSTLTRMSDAVTKLMGQVGHVMDKLDNLTIDPVIDDLRDLIETIRTQVNDARLGTVRDEAITFLKNLEQTNAQMQDLLKRPEIDAFLHGASATATDAAATAAAARQTMEAVQGQVRQILGQADEASHNIQASSARLDALLKSDDLPEAAAHLRALLRRLDAIASQQQQSIETILDNLRTTTENLRDFSRTARENPPQILWGEPPPAPKLENKK